jgi:hypothetical protein
MLGNAGMHIHGCVCVCKCVCVCVCVCVCTYIRTHIDCNTSMRTSSMISFWYSAPRERLAMTLTACGEGIRASVTRIYKNVYVYVYVHTCMYICMYVWMYVYIYIDVYRYI